RQLIETFAQLCKEFPERDLRLVIVGEGPLRDSLERLVETLQLESLVTFAGFSTMPESVMPAFDVFCLPSTSEALGIALLEAMACGCPVIAAAVGGVPEILTDAACGWLVAPRSSPSLLAGLRHVVEMNPETLRAVG